MLSRPIPQPKSKETRKRIRGRKKRAEAAVKKSVRAACVERDGPCRVAAGKFDDDIPWMLWPHVCLGPSEWAHLKGHRRSQTRGQAPERRHTTAHSLMLCRRLHAQEERGTLRVIYLTERGCDGPLRFRVEQ